MIHVGNHTRDARCTISKRDAPSAHDVISLVNTCDWDDAKHSVRSLLFGEMAWRASLVTQEYLSDLYHDASWIERNISGPCTFYWLARISGTNMAEAATIGVEIGAGETATFYRVQVRDVDGQWYAVFDLVPLDQVKHLPTIPTIQHDDSILTDVMCATCGQEVDGLAETLDAQHTDTAHYTSWNVDL